jgi:hypothetical protein
MLIDVIFTDGRSVMPLQIKFSLDFGPALGTWKAK